MMKYYKVSYLNNEGINVSTAPIVNEAKAIARAKAQNKIGNNAAVTCWTWNPDMTERCLSMRMFFAEVW